jgi:hypothetical protein
VLPSLLGFVHAGSLHAAWRMSPTMRPRIPYIPIRDSKWSIVRFFSCEAAEVRQAVSQSLEVVSDFATSPAPFRSLPSDRLTPAALACCGPSPSCNALIWSFPALLVHWSFTAVYSFVVLTDSITSMSVCAGISIAS